MHRMRFATGGGQCADVVVVVGELIRHCADERVRSRSGRTTGVRTMRGVCGSFQLLMSAAITCSPDEAIAISHSTSPHAERRDAMRCDDACTVESEHPSAYRQRVLFQLICYSIIMCTWIGACVLAYTIHRRMCTEYE